jgi:hypothetical protein
MANCYLYGAVLIANIPTLLLSRESLLKQRVGKLHPNIAVQRDETESLRVLAEPFLVDSTDF